MTYSSGKAKMDRFVVGLVVALIGVAGVLLVGPARSDAAFGDFFGIAPVNGGGGQAAPAFAGQQAFWAGGCDLAGAPGIGQPIPAPGRGARPATVLAPNSPAALTYGATPVPAPAAAPHCIDHGGEAAYPGSAIWAVAPDWRLPGAVQAGGHPDGSAAFVLARDPAGAVDGAADNFVVDLPAGFVGDPTAVPKCSAEDFAVVPKRCPVASQVGILQLNLKASVFGNLGNVDMQILPVYNLEPREGNVAELGFGVVSDVAPVAARIVAKARTNGDFGVRTFIGQIPAALPVINQTITLWGVPWARSHDLFRAPLSLEVRGGGPAECKVQPGSSSEHTIPPSGLSPACQRSYDPSWGEVRPFLTNLTECDPANPVTKLAMDSYQNPGSFTSDGDPDLADVDWKTAESAAEPVTGCERLPFVPSASFAPTTGAPDAASGLKVGIGFDQNDDLPFDPPPVGASAGEVQAYVDAAAAHWRSDSGLSASHLDRSVVALADGLTVNPSAATGLEGCSDAQVGLRQAGNPNLFDNVEPSCPDGSKIGTVSATTPLLDGSPNLSGEVFLGSPKSTDPRSGEMFRMFLVLRNPERGLLAKVYGSAVADPVSGRITATFDRNPRVPVERIDLDLVGGPRGVLATPQACGTHATEAVFTPWTAAHDGGGQPVGVSSPFQVGGACGFGFAPALSAGMDHTAARGHGTFSFVFSRPDGQQWLAGLTAKLPKGLLADVSDLALCSDSQAAAGACPAGSRIGVADAAAGAGDPFVLEHKGEVFLTEGYKGAPYGLLVKVRGVAGPFRGALELPPILVRQAVDVDPRTAQVTAVSDPFPLIHQGVPLRVREVRVKIDRPQFMLNPSGCTPKRVAATLTSPQGTAAAVADRFQATGCDRLRFKPRLALRLTGRRQRTTGKHPGVRAVVRQQGIREAGIKRAVVRLPKSLALDVDNAQALCEFDQGTRPDLENHCPKGSIVGRARAVTPLLKQPLVGNVYFVKNVRTDKQTGNQIRTLPTIVVALRGEIAVNLVGKSSTTRNGRLVNTFNQVPDAPVTRFNLNIRGGKRGILAVTRTRKANIDLCARPKSHVAQADMDGHNSKNHDRDIRLKTPCPTAKQRQASQKRRTAAKRKTRQRDAADRRR